MSRIRQIAPESAEGKAAELLATVKAKMGMVPNITRAMANGPAVLEAYLGFSGALGKGALSVKDRERIALAVGQANDCEYCVAAHSAVGKRVGLTPEEVRGSRLGRSADPKSDALVKFARKLVDDRGRVSDADVEEVRSAGFDDGGISEIVANVALAVFTNYFNHVAGTEVDFPAAEPLDALAVG